MATGASESDRRGVCKLRPDLREQHKRGGESSHVRSATSNAGERGQPGAQRRVVSGLRSASVSRGIEERHAGVRSGQSFKKDAGLGGPPRSSSAGVPTTGGLHFPASFPGRDKGGGR